MSSLTILGAAYGLADVTAKVQKMVTSNGTLIVTANNATFGDTWHGVDKSLVLIYRFGTNQPETTVVKENATATINEPSPIAAKATSASNSAAALAVYGAAYGLANVTAQVRNQVVGDALNVTANNATYGDSWPGTTKSMVVCFEGSNGPTMKIVQENQAIHIQLGASLQILGATYGPGDVTEKVRTRIDNQEVHLTADNNTFGDTWKGVTKSLVVTYRYGTQLPQLAIVKEGDRLNLTYQAAQPFQPSSDANRLQILTAAYGLGDVTARTAGLISNNALVVTANNQTFQDQWKGVEKTLVVTYQYGQETPLTKVVKENQTLQIAHNA